MNAQPQFTPGPWHWNESGYSLRPDTISTDVTAILDLEYKGGMIARPQTRPWSETEREVEANARLIAAAERNRESLEGR